MSDWLRSRRISRRVPAFLVDIIMLRGRVASTPMMGRKSFGAFGLWPVMVVRKSTSDPDCCCGLCYSLDPECLGREGGD
ncbi:hypothetical protein AVEN_12183-1 [Araneus ventricosus]|uniref:Uncharacterized protein n=1 Tax=Araneus ventricosus TaxID=182803 RepID=A0A4Y2UDG0_ARAVE|nr:hypothetical protein AVEN_12183-1 [Araneus ventricosus]